jgi:type IV secretory pathway VirB2 component (pilin)
MKTIKCLKYILLIALLAVIATPKAHASTTGSSFGGGLQLVTIGNQIINFLTGPIALIIITLGFVIGAVTVVFAQQRDQGGYKRLGKAIIGGSILVGATSLVTFFFNGALI